MADSLYATSAQGAATSGANECPGRHMPKRSSEVLDNEDCGEWEPRKRRREEDGAAFEATKVVFSDENFEVGASVGKVVGRGHSYEELQMSGNARMHAGDTHNINISGSVTNLRVSYGASIESTHERDGTDQVTSGFRVECRKTALKFLWMLQRLFSRVALQQQILHQVAYLEDALGNFHEVHPGLMNWKRLHCKIAVSFSGQPGHLRVAQKRYRFVDDSWSGNLIDPRNPPRFTDIFQPGRHIRMSMHFEASEVPPDRCPNCRFEQACNVGSETICMSCRFSYHACAEKNDLGDSLTRKHSGGSETMPKHAHRPFAPHDQDKPNKFRRISISISKRFVLTDVLEERTTEPLRYEFPDFGYVEEHLLREGHGTGPHGIRLAFRATNSSATEVIQWSVFASETCSIRLVGGGFNTVKEAAENPAI